MKEFLIQREDKDFCVFHVDKFREVLQPNSIESEKVDGWGDYRIRVDNSEISFSFEMVGIQISFETGEISNEKAEGIMSEICQKVEKEIKESCNWIQISD